MCLELYEVSPVLQGAYQKIILSLYYSLRIAIANVVLEKSLTKLFGKENEVYKNFKSYNGQFAFFQCWFCPFSKFPTSTKK